MGESLDRVRRCRVCGCTDDHACEGGCYWVEADLCSACEEKTEGRAIVMAGTHEARQGEGGAEDTYVVWKGPDGEEERILTVTPQADDGTLLDAETLDSAKWYADALNTVERLSRRKEQGVLPVCFSRHALESLITRDGDGNRLAVDEGEPDEDGFYTLTVTVVYEDNPLRELRDAVDRFRMAHSALGDLFGYPSPGEGVDAKITERASAYVDMLAVADRTRPPVVELGLEKETGE